MPDFEKIKLNVIDQLRAGLNKKLTYHCVEHTLDVLDQSERIAKQENSFSEKEILLLKVAALYHDTGFLFVYRDHEIKGCEMAARQLRHSGFSEEEIDRICAMIMATRIPQSPKNRLEEIICDADLDYLGRNDFVKISNHLRMEFLEYGIVKNDNEWNEMQIAFFESHHYFTNTSRQLRAPVKQAHLKELKRQFKTT